MVKVEILTTPNCGGCSRVEKMLDEMGIKYRVIDVTKNPEILRKHAMMTAPGVVINGKLEFSGVPSKKELEKKVKG